ncbi:GNAT family N-acetyltransferase [Lentzea sp. NPDC058450]|uniref:GNAT family N-acetyltransferase n=1 Tax=Lentzea sp. NPDC058450 TaxID=3346505 RepID=UPI003658AB0E
MTLPIRYEVVRRWVDDEDVVEEVLARVVDVDGLFEDVTPAPRGRLVLRGFTGGTLDGDVQLEIQGSPDNELWRLADLVVHADLGDGDLVATATATCLLDSDELGPSPRFTLSQNSREIGICRAVEGLPREHRGVAPPVTLIGCDTPELIRPGRSDGERGPYVGLRALDPDGRVVAHAGVALDVVSVSPSAVGEGLYDVVLDQSGEAWHIAERPVPAARAAWRIWMEGVPAQRNLWAPLSGEGRLWWNEIAAKARRNRPVAGVHDVDGTYATDECGVHLALSEALVGPGDYLGGVHSITGAYEEWWFVPGITLVWHQPRVALESVPEHFYGLLKYLLRNGVEVLFEPSEPDFSYRLDRGVELGALVDRWITGWARAAEIDPPDALLDNWHVWADLPGREEERILTGDALVAEHAEDVALNPVPAWLTVPTRSPDEVGLVVEEAGLVLREPEAFMVRGLLDHPAPKPPDGYEVRVTPGDVIEVVVTCDGEVAASGRMAVVGEDAVPHDVRTAPDHRRRGLGSVVMGALAREAVKAGASEGLLFATDDGWHLCRKLGWDTICDVVIASNDKGDA